MQIHTLKHIRTGFQTRCHPVTASVCYDSYFLTQLHPEAFLRVFNCLCTYMFCTLDGAVYQQSTTLQSDSTVLRWWALLTAKIQHHGQQHMDSCP